MEESKEREREASNSFRWLIVPRWNAPCVYVCNNKKKRRKRREKGDRQQATPTEHTGTTQKSTHRYITHIYTFSAIYDILLCFLLLLLLLGMGDIYTWKASSVCVVYMCGPILSRLVVSFGSFRCIQHLRFKTYLSMRCSRLWLFSPLVVELPGDDDIPPHIPAPAPRQWRGSHRALICIRTLRLLLSLSLDCCVYRSSSVLEK